MSDTDEIREMKRYYASLHMEDLYYTEMKKVKEKKEKKRNESKWKNYIKQKSICNKRK